MSKPWAVITGASSGIGKALAFEFASRGYPLFLTSRAEQALQTVAAECARRHRCEVRTHAADLADAAQTDGLVLALAAAELEYGVLVNNAGFGVKGKFADTDLAAELDLTHVQLNAMLKLTKALLPGMIHRREGRILNVASVYSFAPVPQQAVYGACKAFLLSFSAALGEEIRGTGVTVTTVCPGVTRTEFRARAGIVEKNTAAGSTPEAVARMAADQALDRRALAVPDLVNKIFVFVARRLPFVLVPRIVNFINNRRGVNY